MASDQLTRRDVGKKKGQASAAVYIQRAVSTLSNPTERVYVGNERPPPDTVAPNPDWPTPVGTKGGQCLCLGIQLD